MDIKILNKLNKNELKLKCSEFGLKFYKSKNKDKLKEMIINYYKDNENNDIKSINNENIINESKDIESIDIKSKDNEIINNEKNFIDLFCGTGAFSFVLENNGYNCVLSNDMVKESQEIYNLNIKSNTFKLKNLNEVNIYEEIPSHNILCGGFPCQPFSIAGNKKGFKDERANVFWKIIEILKYHKPNIIILENVKNLTTHDKGITFKIIKENLKKLGYYIKYKVLDTSKITKIPQHRERIYIIGFLDKIKYNNFKFNFNESKINPIINYLEIDIPKKYYYTEKLKVYNEIKKNITKDIHTNTVYQYRRYYVRENKSNCCPTLTANMGSGGHNVPLIKDDNGIRKLTPRECFNLQGFPLNYKLPDISDTKLYKLAGNAVSIPVVELIINNIKML